MSSPVLIEGILKSVSIPVMAKCRIGHFAEAQILESLGVDYIDESEVLTPADRENHINKWNFNVLLTVAALGYGDIPTQGFINAFNLVEKDGWIAFNIKDRFISEEDDTGYHDTLNAMMTRFIRTRIETLCADPEIETPAFTPDISSADIFAGVPQPKEEK